MIQIEYKKVFLLFFHIKEEKVEKWIWCEPNQGKKDMGNTQKRTIKDTMNNKAWKTSTEDKIYEVRIEEEGNEI